jgi:hypothetical protein
MSVTRDFSSLHHMNYVATDKTRRSEKQVCEEQPRIEQYTFIKKNQANWSFPSVQIHVMTMSNSVANKMYYTCPGGGRNAFGGVVKQAPKQQRDTEMSAGK